MSDPATSDLTIAEWMKPYLPIIGGLVRGLLQLASASGFTWAVAVTGDQVTMAVTAAAMLVTLIWSFWQKIVAVRDKRRAEVAAAKASAQATMLAGMPTPVTVIETAAGVENKTVRISATEIATAPSVPLDVAPLPAPRTP